jgi:hypothetical protein
MPAIRRTLFGGSRRRSQGGQALTELAVAIPLLMILIAAAMDFGSACYLAIEVNSAARAGAQYGAQNAVTMQDGPGIVLAAQNGAPQVHPPCGPTRGRACWGPNGQTVPGSEGQNFSGGSANVPYTGIDWAYGCECASGANITPFNVDCGTCNGNWINYVAVATQANYYPMIPWTGISASYPLSGYAKLRLGTQ